MTTAYVGKQALVPKTFQHQCLVRTESPPPRPRALVFPYKLYPPTRARQAIQTSLGQFVHFFIFPVSRLFFHPCITTSQMAWKSAQRPPRHPHTPRPHFAFPRHPPPPPFAVDKTPQYFACLPRQRKPQQSRFGVIHSSFSPSADPSVPSVASKHYHQRSSSSAFSTILSLSDLHAAPSTARVVVATPASSSSSSAPAAGPAGLRRP